jgi:GH15 family glucan-1,4-alpha-glucosidase
LIDAHGGVVWFCLPRFDGDPVLCSLLKGGGRERTTGTFAIELVGQTRREQEYVRDTATIQTRLYGANGDAIEITDLCPRFEKDGALYCPPVLARQISPLAGSPRVRVSLNPYADYGCTVRTQAVSDGHISYEGDLSLSLVTTAPSTAIADAALFHLDRSVTLMFGCAEGLGENLNDIFTRWREQTESHWRSWVKSLEIPQQWRDAVVRAAITLELNVFEETGAIIAAMTTSIPEAPDTGRNWDYRYCWPRDAYFVANSLEGLGELRTTERLLAFILRVADATPDSRLGPLYTIDGGVIPDERVAQCLDGFRGMGPVHIGNKAREQVQHDVHGEAVLTAEPLFVNSRAKWTGDKALLERLETFGEHAARLYDVPDAGLWELRGSASVHTFSSVMCWAACDRLATYAKRLGLDERSDHWRAHAATIHEVISRRSWNSRMNAFTATMDGDTLDASLLLMPQLRFLRADDPRFVGTVAAIERDLKHGDFVYRYVERDDFGTPENAFLVCTFWYVEALAALGRRDEAVELFEKVLSARNSHGLLAEDLDPDTLEQWGNFPQTYCMAGIISCATALSQ